jgi:hypothetical protein
MGNQSETEEAAWEVQGYTMSKQSEEEVRKEGGAAVT